MKVLIGTDHAGFELKELLKSFIIELGHEVVDKGAFEFYKDDNYPEFIIPTAQAVADANDKNTVGIVIGGSGQGEAMAANRVRGIRATTFYGPRPPSRAVDVTGRQSADEYEMINLSRSHNAANVLALGTRFISDEEAKTAVKLWLGSDAKTSDRYMKRIDQVEDMAMPDLSDAREIS